MPASQPAAYTSKIIKAGALLPDTKLLLTHWNEAESARANLDRMRQQNIFGKASRSRVEDILAIFRQRYTTDPELLGALVTLAQARLPTATLDRVLYFQALQADALLHDVVTDWLGSRAAQGQTDVRVLDIQNWIQTQIGLGKTVRAWSAETVEHAAQEILATLRDFGVLQGAVKKRLGPFYLPATAFAFIAFQLYRRYQSGDQVLNSPEWAVFFLAGPAVERLFLEAHQEGLLAYYAAGRVVRLEFPAPTLEEYARVLAARTY